MRYNCGPLTTWAILCNNVFSLLHMRSVCILKSHKMYVTCENSVSLSYSLDTELIYFNYLNWLASYKDALVFYLLVRMRMSLGAISPLFHNILLPILDFNVKSGTSFSLRDKRLFEISEVEITRVHCLPTAYHKIHKNINIPKTLKQLYNIRFLI